MTSPGYTLGPVPARVAGLAAGVVAAVLVVALGLVVLRWWGGDDDAAAVAAGRSAVPVAWQRPAVAGDAGLVARSGVRITQVAVSGGGGLVDLRYEVVDPDRANALHDPGTPPAVVDEKTGVVVHQLLMNHAHSGPFTAGVTYYLVFDNPANWVTRGSRVTVLLGDAQVEHVVVR
jgi:hypothetical protein